MKALIIIALILHLALAQEESEQEEIVVEEPETKTDPKEAITFFILGDYGTVEPYESSHQVFAAIDQIVGSSPANEKPDFFISIGDNVRHGQEALEPHSFSFDNKRQYMNTPNLRDTPVFVSRGNLDVEAMHWSDMVEASMTQEQFIYPSLYFSKVERLGALNSRIAFMFIDATLFLCSSDTVAEPPTYLDYKAEKCTDPKWQAWGDTQNKWINKTLEEWDQDGSIMYRVLVNHYPIWTVGVNYKPSDFAGLNNELLPILRLEKFDLYLSAHGVTSFANIKPEDSIEEKPQPEFESLLQKAETWFNFAKQDRFKGFDQGQALHQVTIGSSGNPVSQAIVTNRGQPCTFTYAQNLYSSWLQIKVDEKEMFINAKGIDASGQVLDLYSITINRGMRMNTWLMLVIGVVIIITVLSFCVFFCLNRRTEQLKNRRELQRRLERGIELLSDDKSKDSSI